MGGTVSSAEQRPGRAVASFAAALFRRGAVIRAGVVVLVLALLTVAGVLTHFDAGTGGLSADRGLMRMQRMGPPPDLQAAYEELRADTVTIGRPGASRPVAVGMFVGTLAVNPALPGVASVFPGTIRKLMATLSGPSYDAVFAVPLTPALPLKVAVDLDGSNLPGTVSYENSALDLAAVKVSVSQSELGKLIGPPMFFNQPSGHPTDLRRLIIHLGVQPGRAADYVFTSGILKTTGLSQCETSISPGESGSPIGWVSLQGTLVLTGLAVPSEKPGQCGIIGSWLISPFLQLMIANHSVKGSGAFLGVLVQNGPVAGRLASGRRIQGAYVTSVTPAGPAALAGVRAGDVIVRLGNAAVRSGKVLAPELRKYQPGTLHWLTVIRDGRRLRIRVELGREGA
jgi:S1-C subfamily serine protease